MNLLSTEHIEMIDALKQFVGEIDARFELIKISAQEGNCSEALNGLLDVDYLLHVLQESLCYEEISIVEK